MTIIQVLLDDEEAHQLDRDLRAALAGACDTIQHVKELLDRARDNAIHLSLGFDSWTAYFVDLMSATPLQLNAQGEVETMQLMAAETLSTRAIGKALGRSHTTVRRQVEQNVPPASDQGKHPSTTITGLDGKTYPRLPPSRQPAPSTPVDGEDGEVYTPPGAPGGQPTLKPPKPPKRSKAPAPPLLASFLRSYACMERYVNHLEKLSLDKRWATHSDRVASKHRGDLIRSRDALQRIIDRLPD